MINLVRSSPAGRRIENTETSISIDLAVEVIEVILSKCAVKSVVRFKSVCKQWHAIISDPRFIRTHRLQRSKVSENENMCVMWEHVLWGTGSKSSHIYVMRLEDGEVGIEESVFEYAAGTLSIPQCYCDGIFLITVFYHYRNCMLWNPSIQTRTQIFCPSFPDIDRHPRAYTLYHDAATDDYTIVSISYKFYAVYSCKSRSWGEMRDLPRVFPGELVVSVHGCFYQLRDDGGVAYFDARNGAAGQFPQPNDMVVEGGGRVRLSEVSGRLCLHYVAEDRMRLQLWVMEKHGSFENVRWRKVVSMGKEIRDLRFQYSRPICLIDQDRVAFSLSRIERLGNDHVIYNNSQKSFQEINLKFGCATNLFPYRENLFMPSSNYITYY